MLEKNEMRASEDQGSLKAKVWSNDPYRVSLMAASQKGRNLLIQLCNGILRHTILDPQDPWYGGVRCNLDLMIETRGAEACYAMAYLYDQTGDERYRNCAKAMAEFLLKRQSPNGWWINEGGSIWRGTTVFMALALAEAYPFFKVSEPELGNRIQGAIEKAANYLIKAFRASGENINYRLTLAPVLWIASDILNIDSFKEQARNFGELIFSHINKDGLLFGEGYGHRGSLPPNSVDVGYSLGMSLGAVAIYALQAHHEEVLNAVLESAKAHLAFLYPDGSLDNSWGSRCYKWTLLSSKTVHGLPMLLLPLAHLDSVFLTAFQRHCDYMETLIQKEQLETGPHFHKNFDYPHSCIHMTFSHACGLASGLIHQHLSSNAELEPALLPCDSVPWAKSYSTVNVIIHRTKSLMCTLAGSGHSASEEKLFPTIPSGGCVSYLWGKGYGPIQVGSQFNYQRIEPGNMPESFDRPGNLTPRVEYLSSKGKVFSSVFERETAMTLLSDAVSKCRGQLKNLEGVACGVEYEITYEFRDTAIRKIYHISESPKGLIFIREPIVFDPDLCTFERSKRSIRILRPQGGIQVTSLRPLVCQDPTRDTLLWCPFPSVYCLDLKFEYVEGSTWVEFEIICQAGGPYG